MDSQSIPSNQPIDSSPSIFMPTGMEIPELPVAALGERFSYPTTLCGSTSNFQVYYDPTQALISQPVADGVLATCERDSATISDYFEGITPAGLPINVIISPDVPGAYHMSCVSTDIYCRAMTIASVDFTRYLLIAEVVEVFSAAQARGWNCVGSNGEGLSRVLATALYPAELGAFTSAAVWLDTKDRPDFVNTTDPTDRDYTSVGCAVLFLNYLHYQLGFTWKEIVQAGAPTLGQTYANLTRSNASLAGPNDCFQQFTALLQYHYPIGTPSRITTDNPFPLLDPGTTGHNEKP